MPPGGNTTSSSQFGKVLEEWLTKHCRDNHKDHGHEARRILTGEGIAAAMVVTSHRLDQPG